MVYTHFAIYRLEIDKGKPTAVACQPFHKAKFALRKEKIYSDESDDFLNLLFKNRGPYLVAMAFN